MFPFQNLDNRIARQHPGLWRLGCKIYSWNNKSSGRPLRTVPSDLENRIRWYHWRAKTVWKIRLHDSAMCLFWAQHRLMPPVTSPDRHGVSNHWQLFCFFKSLFGLTAVQNRKKYTYKSKCIVIYILLSVDLRLNRFSRLSFMQHMTVCFQLTDFSCDDYENWSTAPYHHQLIGNRNYWQLFRLGHEIMIYAVCLYCHVLKAWKAGFEFIHCWDELI